MVKHFKGEPSEFIIKYHGNKIKKAGQGLNFFYALYKTNIVSIPITTIDSNFIFNEITNNYQKVSLQGHYTYKITDPKKMALILDFSINPETRQYKSTDPEKLELRLTNILQQLTRTEIEKVDLEQALSISNSLALKLLSQMKDLTILEEMGIQILNITFNSIRPTPEISKALEADYREKLQKKADESIYERRAAAVDQERKIKENELNNQIALEQKKKQLIAIQSENQIKKAEINAKVNELELIPYKDLEPNQLLSLAIKDLSVNAGKIGNLTITSEMLSQILNESNRVKK